MQNNGKSSADKKNPMLGKKTRHGSKISGTSSGETSNTNGIGVGPSQKRIKIEADDHSEGVKKLKPGNSNQVPKLQHLEGQPGMRKPTYNGIRGMFNLKTLLNCRLVCKQWKETIDKILQHSSIDNSMEPFRLAPWNYLGFKLEIPVTNLRVNHDNKDKVEALLGYLLEVQRKCPEYNPFPSRHLRIEISRASYVSGHFELVSQSEWKTLTQIVSNFLKAFGKHVLHLTLDVLWIYNKEADFRNEIGVILSTWLVFVPRIKSLILLNATGGSQQNNIQISPSKSFTFPYLKNLDTFIFTGRWESSNVFLCKFLETNRNVRAVDIYSHSSVNGVRNLYLSNPSDVSLRIYGPNDLLELSQTSWTLSKLSLSDEPEKYYRKINITFKEIAQTVNKFKNTLQVLNLNMAHVENLEEGTLILPRLKHLKLIHHNHKYSCINWTNFLHCMVALETIDLQCGSAKSCFSGGLQKMQNTFCNYVNNFWKANSLHDWNSFPFLTNVKLTVLDDFYRGNASRKNNILLRRQM